MEREETLSGALALAALDTENALSDENLQVVTSALKQGIDGAVKFYKDQRDGAPKSFMKAIETQCLNVVLPSLDGVLKANELRLSKPLQGFANQIFLVMETLAESFGPLSMPLGSALVDLAIKVGKYTSKEIWGVRLKALNMLNAVLTSMTAGLTAGDGDQDVQHEEAFDELCRSRLIPFITTSIVTDLKKRSVTDLTETLRGAMICTATHVLALSNEHGIEVSPDSSGTKTLITLVKNLLRAQLNKDKTKVRSAPVGVTLESALKAGSNVLIILPEEAAQDRDEIVQGIWELSATLLHPQWDTQFGRKSQKMVAVSVLTRHLSLFKNSLLSSYAQLVGSLRPQIRHQAHLPDLINSLVASLAAHVDKSDWNYAVDVKRLIANSIEVLKGHLIDDSDKDMSDFSWEASAIGLLMELDVLMKEVELTADSFASGTHEVFDRFTLMSDLVNLCLETLLLVFKEQQARLKEVVAAYVVDVKSEVKDAEDVKYWSRWLNLSDTDAQCWTELEVIQKESALGKLDEMCRKLSPDKVTLNYVPAWRLGRLLDCVLSTLTVHTKWAVYITEVEDSDACRRLEEGWTRFGSTMSASVKDATATTIGRTLAAFSSIIHSLLDDTNHPFVKTIQHLLYNLIDGASISRTLTSKAYLKLWAQLTEDEFTASCCFNRFLQMYKTLAESLEACKLKLIQTDLTGGHETDAHNEDTQIRSFTQTPYGITTLPLTQALQPTQYIEGEGTAQQQNTNVLECSLDTKVQEALTNIETIEDCKYHMERLTGIMDTLSKASKSDNLALYVELFSTLNASNLKSEVESTWDDQALYSLDLLSGVISDLLLRTEDASRSEEKTQLRRLVTTLSQRSITSHKSYNALFMKLCQHFFLFKRMTYTQKLNKQQEALIEAGLDTEKVVALSIRHFDLVGELQVNKNLVQSIGHNMINILSLSILLGQEVQVKGNEVEDEGGFVQVTDPDMIHTVITVLDASSIGLDVREATPEVLKLLRFLKAVTQYLFKLPTDLIFPSHVVSRLYKAVTSVTEKLSKELLHTDVTEFSHVVSKVLLRMAQGHTWLPNPLRKTTETSNVDTSLIQQSIGHGFNELLPKPQTKRLLDGVDAYFDFALMRQAVVDTSGPEDEDHKASFIDELLEQFEKTASDVKLQEVISTDDLQRVGSILEAVLKLCETSPTEEAGNQMRSLLTICTKLMVVIEAELTQSSADKRTSFEALQKVLLLPLQRVWQRLSMSHKGNPVSVYHCLRCIMSLMIACPQGAVLRRFINVELEKCRVLCIAHQDVKWIIQSNLIDLVTEHPPSAQASAAIAAFCKTLPPYSARDPLAFVSVWCNLDLNYALSKQKLSAKEVVKRLVASMIRNAWLPDMLADALSALSAWLMSDELTKECKEAALQAFLSQITEVIANENFLIPSILSASLTWRPLADSLRATEKFQSALMSILKRYSRSTKSWKADFWTHCFNVLPGLLESGGDVSVAAHQDMLGGTLNVLTASSLPVKPLAVGWKFRKAVIDVWSGVIASNESLKGLSIPLKILKADASVGHAMVCILVNMKLHATMTAASESGSDVIDRLVHSLSVLCNKSDPGSLEGTLIDLVTFIGSRSRAERHRSQGGGRNVPVRRELQAISDMFGLMCHLFYPTVEDVCGKVDFKQMLEFLSICIDAANSHAFVDFIARCLIRLHRDLLIDDANEVFERRLLLDAVCLKYANKTRNQEAASTLVALVAHHVKLAMSIAGQTSVAEVKSDIPNASMWGLPAVLESKVTSTRSIRDLKGVFVTSYLCIEHLSAEASSELFELIFRRLNGAISEEGSTRDWNMLSDSRKMKLQSVMSCFKSLLSASLKIHVTKASPDVVMSALILSLRVVHKRSPSVTDALMFGSSAIMRLHELVMGVPLQSVPSDLLQDWTVKIAKQLTLDMRSLPGVVQAALSHPHLSRHIDCYTLETHDEALRVDFLPQLFQTYSGIRLTMISDRVNCIQALLEKILLPAILSSLADPSRDGLLCAEVASTLLVQLWPVVLDFVQAASVLSSTRLLTYDSRARYLSQICSAEPDLILGQWLDSGSEYYGKPLLTLLRRALLTLVNVSFVLGAVSACLSKLGAEVISELDLQAPSGTSNGKLLVTTLYSLYTKGTKTLYTDLVGIIQQECLNITPSEALAFSQGSTAMTPGTRMATQQTYLAVQTCTSVVCLLRARLYEAIITALVVTQEDPTKFFVQRFLSAPSLSSTWEIDTVSLLRMVPESETILTLMRQSTDKATSGEAPPAIQMRPLFTVATPTTKPKPDQLHINLLELTHAGPLSEAPKVLRNALIGQSYEIRTDGSSRLRRTTVAFSKHQKITRAKALVSLKGTQHTVLPTLSVLDTQTQDSDEDETGTTQVGLSRAISGVQAALLGLTAVKGDNESPTFVPELLEATWVSASEALMLNLKIWDSFLHKKILNASFLASWLKYHQSLLELGGYQDRVRPSFSIHSELDATLACILASQSPSTVCLNCLHYMRMYASGYGNKADALLANEQDLMTVSLCAMMSALMVRQSDLTDMISTSNDVGGMTKLVVEDLPRFLVSAWKGIKRSTWLLRDMVELVSRCLAALNEREHVDYHPDLSHLFVFCEIACSLATHNDPWWATTQLRITSKLLTSTAQIVAKTAGTDVFFTSAPAELAKTLTVLHNLIQVKVSRDKMEAALLYKKTGARLLRALIKTVCDASRDKLGRQRGNSQKAVTFLPKETFSALLQLLKTHQVGEETQVAAAELVAYHFASFPPRKWDDPDFASLQDTLASPNIASNTKALVFAKVFMICPLAYFECREVGGLPLTPLANLVESELLMLPTAIHLGSMLGLSQANEAINVRSALICLRRLFWLAGSWLAKDFGDRDDIEDRLLKPLLLPALSEEAYEEQATAFQGRGGDDDEEPIEALTSSITSMVYDRLDVSGWRQLLAVPEVRMTSSDRDDTHGCFLTHRQAVLLVCLQGLKRRVILDDQIYVFASMLFQQDNDEDDTSVMDAGSRDATLNSFQAKWFPGWQSHEAHAITTALLQGVAHQLWAISLANSRAGDPRFAQISLLDPPAQKSVNVGELQNQKSVGHPKQRLIQDVFFSQSEGAITSLSAFINNLVDDGKLLEPSESLALVLGSRSLFSVLIELLIRRFEVAADVDIRGGTSPSRRRHTHLLSQSTQRKTSSLILSLPPTVRMAIDNQSKGMARLIAASQPESSQLFVKELSQSLKNTWLAGLASQDAMEALSPISTRLPSDSQLLTQSQSPLATTRTQLLRRTGGDDRFHQGFKYHGRSAKEWVGPILEVLKVQDKKNENRNLTKALWDMALKRPSFAKLILTSLLCNAEAESAQSLRSQVVLIVRVACLVQHSLTKTVMMRSEESWFLFSWIVELLVLDDLNIPNLLQFGGHDVADELFFNLLQAQKYHMGRDASRLRLVFEQALLHLKQQTKRTPSTDEMDEPTVVITPLTSNDVDTTVSADDLQLKLCLYNGLLADDDYDFQIWKSASEAALKARPSVEDEIAELFGGDSTDWRVCLSKIEKAQKSTDLTQLLQAYGKSTDKSKQTKWLNDVTLADQVAIKVQLELDGLEKDLYNRCLTQPGADHVSEFKTPLLSYMTTNALNVINHVPPSPGRTQVEAALLTMVTSASPYQWLERLPSFIIRCNTEKQYNKTKDLETKAAQQFLLSIKDTNNWVDVASKASLCLVQPEGQRNSIPLDLFVTRLKKHRYGETRQFMQIACVNLVKSLPSRELQMLRLIEAYDIPHLSPLFPPIHFVRAHLTGPDLRAASKLYEWVLTKSKLSVQSMQDLDAYKSDPLYGFEATKLEEDIYLKQLGDIRACDPQFQTLWLSINEQLDWGHYPKLALEFLGKHFDEENVNPDLVLTRFIPVLLKLAPLYVDWIKTTVSSQGFGDLKSSLEVRCGQFLSALISSGSKLKKVTIQQVERDAAALIECVPVEVWIRWIEQILTLVSGLDKSAFPSLTKALQKLIENFVRDFPHVAVSFVRVTYESRVFAEARSIFVDHVLSDNIQFLHTLLYSKDYVSPIYHQFILGLEVMNSPVSIYQSAFINLVMRHINMPADTRDASIAFALARLLSITSFFKHYGRSGSTKSIADRVFPPWLDFFESEKEFYGTRFHHFCNYINDFFKKLLPKAGTRGDLFSTLLTNFITHLNKKTHPTVEALKSYLDKTTSKEDKSSVSLETFSPFLINRNFGTSLLALQNAENATVKIPIAAFSNQILALESKQEPKKITYYLTDGSCASLMVKAGDDLRVDRRVNSFVDQVRTELERQGVQTGMRSYSVFATSSFCGAIEWCEGTTTYKSLLEKYITGSKLHMSPEATKMRTAVTKWFEAHKKTPAKKGAAKRKLEEQKRYPLDVQWGDWAVLAAREAVTTAFHGASKTPRTMFAMRNLMLMISPSVKSFLQTRKHFLNTLGSINAVSYILGIGDRHADNMLIETRTMTPIMIDFGYSLNFTVAGLGVPECMPFRWTPYLQSLEPAAAFDSAPGYMSQTLISTMKLMRDKRHLFAQLLRIFVEAPLQDLTWFFEASVQLAPRDGDDKSPPTKRRAVTEDGSPKAGSSHESYEALHDLARSKLRTVRWKLMGLNPGAVLLSDLKKNGKPVVRENLRSSAMTAALFTYSCNSSPLEGLRQLGRSLRDVTMALLEQDQIMDDIEPMDVDVQCDMLTAMATSPDILGRAWFGWMAAF